MPGVRGFSTLRARSYIFRLPLFTRAIILIIIIFWAVSLPSIWDIKGWGALVPDKVSFTTGEQLELPPIPHRGRIADNLHQAYRLSTFPLVHLNLIHAALNVVALTPLMERFENEYGTLPTLSLFFGREGDAGACFAGGSLTTSQLLRHSLRFCTSSSNVASSAATTQLWERGETGPVELAVDMDARRTNV